MCSSSVYEAKQLSFATSGTINRQLEQIRLERLHRSLKEKCLNFVV